jgi:hypothetical protein
MTGQIAYYVREGSAAFQVMSEQHASFSVEQNAEKYDRVVRERPLNSSYGWPTCRAIEDAGSTKCMTCPHMLNGEAKKPKASPFHFIRRIAEAAPAVVVQDDPVDWRTTDVELYGPIPAGCYRDQEGFIYIDRLTEEGKLIRTPLSLLPMRYIDVTKDPSMMIYEVIIASDRVQVEITIGTLGDPRRLSTTLGDRFGVAYSVNNAKLFGDVFMPFVQDLLTRKQERQVVQRNGWTYDDSMACSGVIYAGVQYSPIGEKRVSIADRQFHEHYHPVGSVDVWRNAYGLVAAEQQPALDAIVAASFGALLMQHTGEPGAMLCPYSSGSGRGKSAAVKVGQSVWGSPTMEVLAVDDTRNRADKTLGLLNNLPMYWDELVEPTLEFMRLISAISQGTQRKKLLRSSDLMPAKDFATLVIAATNFSISDAAAQHHKTTSAPLYRVFEYEVPKLKHANGNVAIQFADLQRNYGGPGAIYAKFLGSKAPKIREYVQETVAGITNDLAAKKDERFWVAVMACIVGGASLANQAGLTAFNVGALYDFLKREFLRLRQFVTDTGGNIDDADDLKRMIGSFLNAYSSGFIRTDDMNSGGRARPNSILITHPKGILSTNRPRLVAQYGEAPNLLRFSKSMFMEYLELKKVPNRTQIVANLVKMFGAKFHRLALGSGSPWVAANEYLIELDLNRPDLQDLL